MSKSVVRLGLLLLVAFGLRLLFLGRQSLWLDEFGSWAFASRDIRHVLQSEPTNPPVYYLLLHYWIRVFGTSEWGLRSLSIVPSVISVWLVYVFSKELFDDAIAYLATAYQTLSTFQIYYAQEARCFALLEMILLAATICLWRALGSGISRRRHLYYGCYTLLSALALYTHFITVFFLAGHGIYALLRKPRQVWNAALSIGVSLLLFFPWLLTMVHVAGKGGQIRRYLGLKLPQAYFSFLYGDSLIPLDDQAVRHVTQTLVTNWWILLAAFVSLALLVPFARIAWKDWREQMWFVLAMGIVPVLFAFLVSFKIMLFSQRYLIPASPFVYMAVAAIIWEIWVAWGSKRLPMRTVYGGWASCGLYVMLLALSLRNYYFNPRFGKEEWREADAYIDGVAKSGAQTLIVFDPDYLISCYRYYSKRNLPAWQVTPPIEAALTEPNAMLDQHTQGYEQILLVRSHDEDETVVRAFQKSFIQESYRKFTTANPIEVYSFRKPPQ